MSKQINDLNKSLEEQLHLNEKQDKTDNNLKTNDKTVVGAINELFQSANNGKQLIASAIGEPLNSSDTFSAMSNKINTIKSDLKQVLTDEGVSVTEGDTISSLIGKVDSEFDRQVVPAGNATIDNVIAGKTFMNSSGELLTGNIVNQPAITNAISVGRWETDIYFRIPHGVYLTNSYDGYPEILCNATDIDSNIKPENIVSGKVILGVTGTAPVGYRLVAGTDYTLATYNSGAVRKFSATTYVKDSGTYWISLTFVGKGYTKVTELTIIAGSTTVYNGPLDNRDNGNGGYTTGIPYYINTSVTVNAGDTISIYFNDGYYYNSISGSVTFSID